MKIINSSKLPESSTSSPKGRFGRANRDLSIALGRDPESTDLMRRQPFDVQICRIPPGKARCPFHLHTGQWEFFHVISGAGSVRHKEGTEKIARDDAFIFAPGEPHQLINDGSEDLVIYIVADNPIAEACYYPDSKKWAIVPGPIVRSEPADYFDGEE
jgi:mannose-6-phosphate isomerase-like protein (cupin superfamily)